MSIRDLMLNVLIAIGLAFGIIFVAAADSLPMWLLIVVAAIAWIVSIVLVVRDHQRDIKFPLIRHRPRPIPTRVVKAPQTTAYDQKEDQQ